MHDQELSQQIVGSNLVMQNIRKAERIMAVSEVSLPLRDIKNLRQVSRSEGVAN